MLPMHQDAHVLLEGELQTNLQVDTGVALKHEAPFGADLAPLNCGDIKLQVRCKTSCLLDCPKKRAEIASFTKESWVTGEHSRYQQDNNERQNGGTCLLDSKYVPNLGTQKYEPVSRNREFLLGLTGKINKPSKTC